MTDRASKTVRCAIYTRVSTDAGLDQEFNSLDAQFDASAAYIKSQAHAGWKQLQSRYDDGGFSGGSVERPALQQLLTDIRAGKIDVIIVYKVDRLTRSLADFAKLVELFDKHGVSFVSVTQQFNTTTSMGRLTLNVLLSFAQFEREVTSERIRDKIAASKRKGLWVGGVVPLGYRLEDHKIKIEEREAKTVRHIFQRYLALKSHRSLISELRTSGIKTKVRQLSNGRTLGGIPFTRGPIAYMLRNRFYVGEVVYKGEILKSEHKPLLDRDVFEAVQKLLGEQRNSDATKLSKSDSPLLGRIFDDRGNRMTPVIAKKNGRRYRYYISSALHQGKSDEAGAIPRVAADQIETLLVGEINSRWAVGMAKKLTATASKTSEASGNSDIRDLIRNHVVRVEIAANTIKTTLKPKDPDDRPLIVAIPWRKRPGKMPRELIPAVTKIQPSQPKPIRAENRARLVGAISRSRSWIRQLQDGHVASTEEIARRDKCSLRQVNMTLSLAFLSPRLVEAAVAGRLPRGVGIANLRDLPLIWAEQHRQLCLDF